MQVPSNHLAGVLVRHKHYPVDKSQSLHLTHWSHKPQLAFYTFECISALHISVLNTSRNQTCNTSQRWYHCKENQGGGTKSKKFYCKSGSHEVRLQSAICHGKYYTLHQAVKMFAGQKIIPAIMRKLVNLPIKWQSTHRYQTRRIIEWTL